MENTHGKLSQFLKKQSPDAKILLVEVTIYARVQGQTSTPSDFFVFCDN